MRKHALATLLVLTGWAPLAHAQLILDEEFSSAANQLTAPLRKTLAPQTSVHYVLVNNPEINAFATPENIVYVHSGLIAKTTEASELQGVLAHEIGHIAGNHLFNQELASKRAAIGAMAGAVLGIGAAAAGGGGQAASAIAMGGQAGAIQSILAHTRTQEAEADRHAINALHSAGLSVQGMVDMFTTLRTESQLSYDAPPPWLVTHPLPPERLANLTEVTQAESPALKTGLLKVNSSFNYPRLQAKVFALTGTPASVLRRYLQEDNDTARYARAIAYLRQGKLDFAESQLSPLLKSHPEDAFYREIEAKLALERGNLGGANAILSKVVAANPDAPTFQYQLAEVLRNQDDFTGAMRHYEAATRLWPVWADPWLGLGLTYGNLGRLAESHLARAQGFLVAPDLEAAKQSLALAKDYLKKAPDPKAQQWADSLQSRLDNLK